MLAIPTHRRQLYSQSITIPHQDLHHHQQQQQQQPYWSATSTSTIPSTTATTSAPHISSLQSQYNNNSTSTISSFGDDQPLFDFHPQQHFPSSQSQPLMQSEHTHNSWLENGQLTPRSTTRAHHREPSLSSLGSAGPSSPYAANTSNPHIAGDVYHEFHDYQHNSSKPLTPAHTPSQEQFLTPQYSNYYHNSNLAFPNSHDGLPRFAGTSEMMSAPELNHSGRPSISSVANDSPSTPPAYEESRQKTAYRNTVPKLDRTMTDIYSDELYNPNFQITTAPSTNPAPAVTVPPPNDVFSQRLQAANSQHLSANIQAPLTIPSRERSPFRQGSPLAPTGNSFSPQSPNIRFGTAQHLRQQQKAESDARALQQQLERATSEHSAPKTISPKDVDLVYHENEEDANTPLFPSQQSQRQPTNYRQQAVIPHDASEDDTTSQRSFVSMATTRRESSSAYSASSQTTQHQGNFNFVPPAVAGSVRQIPQQYPFVPNSRRQPSNLSNVSEDFPSTLASMESSSSEYAPESSVLKKPHGAAADTGTYTCTYHGCTLRFDTPAKLQKHKREGHRNSAVIGAGDEGGMTSAAQRNSQAGPHKCERINPSTGKPCNTIFSRPYDLTRHEDTIHNARKLKVHCPLCTEEKTFSRNDALTRHLRVVHPEHVDMSKSRRRAALD